jgi:hypothetical protein
MVRFCLDVGLGVAPPPPRRVACQRLHDVHGAPSDGV